MKAIGGRASLGTEAGPWLGVGAVGEGLLLAEVPSGVIAEVSADTATDVKFAEDLDKVRVLWRSSSVLGTRWDCGALPALRRLRTPSRRLRHLISAAESTT